MNQNIWESVYQITLQCSKKDNVYDFSVELFLQIQNYFTFDCGQIWFLDVNRKLENVYQSRVGKEWSEVYADYYLNTAEEEFRVNRQITEGELGSNIRLIDYSETEDSSFVKDYIRPRQLKYSCSFFLSDSYGRPRTIFDLNRKGKQQFCENEIDVLVKALPLLNSIHKKYFLAENKQSTVARYLEQHRLLTDRETEIVNLVCEGVSTTNISHILRIAPKTLEKHMSNIYKKMNVSRRQELIVKIMNQRL